MECTEGNGQLKPVQSTAAAVGSIDEQVVHESSPTIDPRGLDTDDDVVDHQLLPSVSVDSNPTSPTRNVSLSLTYAQQQTKRLLKVLTRTVR